MSGFTRIGAAGLLALSIMAGLVVSTSASEATFTDPSESGTSSVTAAASFGG